MLRFIYHASLGIFWYGALLLTVPLTIIGVYKPSLYAGFFMLLHNEQEGAALEELHGP